MEQIRTALETGAGMLWEAFWALGFGYLISAAIQVLVAREQMARRLGGCGPKQAILSGFFGFVSSCCSFVALAASRSVLVKGAHPVNALAFLVALTNLMIELGLVLLVLLGWHVLVGNNLVGVLMIVYVCTVAAGVTVHLLSATLNLLPTARPSLGEMTRFKIDYTFWLNMAFVVLGGMFWILHRQSRQQRGNGHGRQEANCET